MNGRTREEQLFAARAEWQASRETSVPPFDAVLARVRADVAARPSDRRAAMPRFIARRSSIVVAFAAAAAAIAIGVGVKREATPAAIVAEPIPSFACFDDESSLAAEASAYATDSAVATAESQFGQCLVATPASGAGGVTCGGVRPLHDEIFESRIPGDWMQ